LGTTSATGNGVNSYVVSMVVDLSNNLYIGGYFDFLADGATSMNRIAKWTNTGGTGGYFSPLGTTSATGNDFIGGRCLLKIKK
jgi:hypothetical protein